MRRWIAAIAVALVLAALAWLMWDYLTVDECLDRGGRWHEAGGRCVP